MKNIWILTLLLAAPAFAAERATPTSSPPATEILKTLVEQHPRLLLTADDLSKLKTEVSTDTRLKEWYGRLKREADQLLTAEPSKYEIPDGLRLLATSRRVMNRTYTLALVFRFEKDAKYAERLWKEISAAAQFPDWNTRHFLDTAEMTHAFAIAYDWLFETWTEDQRKQMQAAMVEKGLQPARAIYEKKSSWSRARHNWNQVCNGGIGMGALALGKVEPELASVVLKGAVDSLPLAMVEFAPDGAWNEGPGYWNYATMYNVVFLAGLNSALGTDFGLSGIRGFSLTGLFPLYITGPLDRTFNYADGGDRGTRGAQISWLARRFDQPVLNWYEQQTGSPSALDLVWYNSKAISPTAAKLPLDKYWRSAEVVTLRGAWEDNQASFVGFKAGDNKANHSHLDLGSFVFDALGVRWAVDMGAENYNLPGYFGNQRWTYYRLRAEGQNTFVVNPGTGPDQDPSAATPIAIFQSSANRAFAVANLTPAYSKHATRVQRGVALLDRTRLLIQDELEASTPVQGWWFMHTSAEAAIAPDGRSAELTEKGAKLRAEIIGPGKWNFQLMEAKPLPGSPHPEKQAENKGIRKLAVHLQDTTIATLSVLLTPVTDRNFGPVKQTRLSDW